MSDLISRQAVMDAFLAELTRRERNNLLHTWTTVDVKYFIAKTLEQLPTVDAVPVKHGRWIVTLYTDYDDTYECSVCGESWTFIEGTPKDNGCDYCPHCGAKMDEVTE